jgi:protein tyrosine/serine phosphatase
MNSAPLTNFRDFGGRESMHGGHLQRGLLFRCGQLHHLTPEQHDYLTRMNFDLAVDLRHGRERIRHPMPWPVDPVRKLFTVDDDGMDGAPHKELLRKGPITSADVNAFYHNFYRRLPFDTAYRDLFTRSMIALSATQGRVLIYCTAGKDRTGMMVALVQHVLGMHQADVHSDYLRSRESPELSAQADLIVDNVQSRLGYQLEPTVARRLMSVELSYIAAFFQSIEDGCGSVANYLAQCGFTEHHAAKLRAQFLTSASK